MRQKILFACDFHVLSHVMWRRPLCIINSSAVLFFFEFILQSFRSQEIIVAKAQDKTLSIWRKSYEYVNKPSNTLTPSLETYMAGNSGLRMMTVSVVASVFMPLKLIPYIDSYMTRSWGNYKVLARIHRQWDKFK